ncbi:energy transducer TonB [Sphingomonas sp.]|uniref:energy transducer TonB family protein n=1 Tax=Sphingomonas sp. TaxID=28214 RepID=UPI001B0EC6EE|nr:energy transducer TonB [Sphingomonas sp.]MBO9714461.1 TonB family protein [Sphingomonas sp.]
MAAAIVKEAGVRRAVAPSLRLRALALVLALAATLLPFAVLLHGLSVKAIEAMREQRTLIDWIPLPPPAPPPPPPERPQPVHRATHPHPGAPAPAAAAPPPVRPDAPVQAPIATAPPASPPAPSEGSGVAGDGAGKGAGTGVGGRGAGGIGGTGNGGPALTQASWVSEPGTPELAPYNPARAARDRVNGQILLACRVLRTGSVTNCRVEREAPKGYGFGRAALQASAIFRFHPPTRDGVALEGWIEIPVAFNNRR